jgi:hypothetical protein
MNDIAMLFAFLVIAGFILIIILYARGYKK